MPTTNAISGIAPNSESENVEFDFRPYLDNQYFEPGSCNGQVGTGSSMDSFLPPQDFEKLFSDPVKPALCPLAMMGVRDMMEGYPMEFLHLPDDITGCSSVGVA